MSKYFAALQKAGRDLSAVASDPGASPDLPTQVGEYSRVINHLLRVPGTLLLVDCGSGDGALDVAKGISTELASSRRRVVIVPVNGVMVSSSQASAQKVDPQPFLIPNTWVWPSPLPNQDVFGTSPCVSPAEWLERLQSDFDYVLLACHASDAIKAVVEVAAFVSATLLVLESGVTVKSEIRTLLHALNAKGAKVAGSVLIKRS